MAFVPASRPEFLISERPAEAALPSSRVVSRGAPLRGACFAVVGAETFPWYVLVLVGPAFNYPSSLSSPGRTAYRCSTLTQLRHLPRYPLRGACFTGVGISRRCRRRAAAAAVSSSKKHQPPLLSKSLRSDAVMEHVQKELAAFEPKGLARGGIRGVARGSKVSQGQVGGGLACGSQVSLRRGSSGIL